MTSLPVNTGGIGVRKVRDTALPAYLSSVNAVSPLVSTMLNQPTLNIEEIASYEDSLNAWNRLHSDAVVPEAPTQQKQWDAFMVKRSLYSLHFARDEDKARFLAIQRTESGAWLHALPSALIGTLLDNNVFRIIMGLRLGLDICSPHVCKCGSQVDKKGPHGLKCKKSAGRHARHAELNAIIKRALLSAEIPSQLEPTGLVRSDSKRVDGMTLIPWSKGRTLIWDATCTDTLAPSNLQFSSRQAGRAADDKAKRKTKKYESLMNQNYHFIPFAVETMGPSGQEAIGFFNDLCKLIARKTYEQRSKSFLQQRLSMPE